MKNILIPIDYKLNSFDAIDYAVTLFSREKCHFYFLNTYTYDVEGLNTLHLLHSSNDWFNKPKIDSQRHLGRIIQKYTVNNKRKEHRFNAISECTNLLEGIKKTIKTLEIDLVVVAGKKQIGTASEKYSRNTKRIIENIRECPVMIIPSSAKIQKHPEFVLVSNFEVALPKSELENWYELVKIVKGSIKIVTLSAKEKMTPQQKSNQNKVRFYIEMLSETPVTVEYLETVMDLKHFANYHSDYIICLMDRKPGFFRKCGLAHSRITKLGPFSKTPLMALHR